ncbi:hypothetical protein FRC19_000717 [Serendipita sp. 401]|nr:hypothetical protein FRC19_000717 [Serendipita sp. 401]
MSATHNNTSDTQTTSGVIQSTSTHLGLVGAIVCGAIFVIFIGWAVLEATHRARAALFTNKNSSEQTESPDAAKFKSFPSTTAVSHTTGDYRGSSSTTVTLASPEMPAPAHLPRT